MLGRMYRGTVLAAESGGSMAYQNPVEGSCCSGKPLPWKSEAHHSMLCTTVNMLCTHLCDGGG
jgi:hypothetical protein